MNSRAARDLREYGPITGVAVYFDDARVVSLPRPARHCDLIARLVADGESEVDVYRAEQGFVTASGKFLRRTVARHYALRTEQIAEAHHPTKLFSDDLW